MRARSQRLRSGHIAREYRRGSPAIVERFGFCSAMGVIHVRFTGDKSILSDSLQLSRGASGTTTLVTQNGAK